MVQITQEQQNRLAFYVSAYESGSLIGRAKINDRHFDELRQKAAKEALQTGVDASDCVQWFTEAIEGGLLRFVAPQLQIDLHDLDEASDGERALAKEAYLSSLIHHFYGVENLLQAKIQFEAAMECSGCYPSDNPDLQKQMSPWFKAADAAWDVAFQRIGRSPQRDHPYFEVALVDGLQNEARVERQSA